MRRKVAKWIGGLCILSAVLAGCQGAQTSSNENTDQEETVVSQEETVETEETTELQDTSDEEIVVRVASLKGPTSIGLVKMMDDNDGSYEFGIYTAADEILPLVVGGKVDIVSIPANVAAVLYQKTEGNIAVLDINTLGVLYVVSYDDSIQTISDLKDKTVYMTGKGTTPEYAFDYILSQNEMDPESDLTIEFKSEATEVISALKNDSSAVAVLPQPYVIVAMTQLEGLQINISLTDEWEDMVTGVTIVNREFLTEHQDLVEAFLEAQSESVSYVNANAEEMAQSVEAYDIVKAAVAEKAIPYCNLVCIQGSEMKEMLGNYLEVLYEQDASSVGGQLPEDDFYFNAQ